MTDDELLDYFDADGRALGVAPRRAVHDAGYWHRALHLWLASDEGGGSALLFQLRAQSVASWPGRLDVSVAGHLLAGETYLDGLRESQEEIGIAVPPDAVIALGERREVGPVAGGGLNRELQGVYIARLEPAWGSFGAIDREAAGLFRIDNAEGLRLHRGEVDAIDCDALVLVDGAIQHERRRVTAASFVPRADYYVGIHLIAAALLAGAQLPPFAAAERWAQ